MSIFFKPTSQKITVPLHPVSKTRIKKYEFQSRLQMAVCRVIDAVCIPGILAGTDGKEDDSGTAV